ncbi:hypothetical protein VSR01_08895 [Actinacidiphila sp. DG2A-62]|uniref:hypothetical protein n=1 Tax=Actinacidiphila sp. DG2A-62 TaxID=3108821 RepID=UPI002DB9D608|nr:hypothetical protein [Actinacidiphila sp. DG2A-62]MEC3993647.1 hypothetical protein [Actinacidiphila sp. DG2A-62]
MTEAQCALLRRTEAPEENDARLDKHARPSARTGKAEARGDEALHATRSTESPLDRFRRAAPWRLPPVAERDDDNLWVTGRCWLWCGRESARVVWLGPATVLGVSADVFACAACTQSLADQILDTQMARDTGPELGLTTVGAIRPHALSPPSGRHRRLP